MTSIATFAVLDGHYIRQGTLLSYGNENMIQKMCMLTVRDGKRRVYIQFEPFYACCVCFTD